MSSEGRLLSTEFRAISTWPQQVRPAPCRTLPCARRAGRATRQPWDCGLRWRANGRCFIPVLQAVNENRRGYVAHRVFRRNLAEVHAVPQARVHWASGTARWCARFNVHTARYRPHAGAQAGEPKAQWSTNRSRAVATEVRRSFHLSVPTAKQKQSASCPIIAARA
jgi:hypothetical protein